MQNSLLIAAVIVFGLWVIILGIYLVTSRKQVSMEETIEDLEQQLDRMEKDAG